MNRPDEHISVIYFLGIGGIGMSALARYYNQAGMQVSGYDKTPSALTEELQNEGIELSFDESIEGIPAKVRIARKNEVLVVLTPAVPAEHPQLKHFRKESYQIIKRSELLGKVCDGYKTIAIAGTHGKTTTSAMVAHILTAGGHGCQAFLGGITANYGTNLLLSDRSELCVAEADEYDRSFLALHPWLAVITSMDADHLDIYSDVKNMQKSFFDFAGNIQPGGTLFLREGLPKPAREDIHIQSYAVEDQADYSGRDVTIREGKYHFDLHYPGGVLKSLSVGLPGRHNVENAIAAAAVCLKTGAMPEDLIREGLSSFKGVKRRFEYVLEKNGHAFIDDYAHHPTELEACIRSLKEMYPGKKITGVFQPHLYSRTRDFADGFAKSLELLDKVILLPIYPAREQPLPGVDSQLILNKITKRPKKLVEKSQLLDLIGEDVPEVFVTLGAGDIDRLVRPLKEALEALWN